MAADPTQREELEEVVHTLAGWERGSASEGERRAAEWISGRLREHGLEPRVEGEPAHGGYWWPLGLFSLLGAVAALVRRAALRVPLALVAALGIFDDLTLFRMSWTRRWLPRGTTHNVWAQAGDPAAQRTLVIAAHHDAAHGGAVFDPTLVRALARRFPERLEAARSWPRINWLVWVGPVLVALGLRRLGAAFCLGSAATFADVGRRGVVPGANDNLTAVAVVVALARALHERPVAGLRVVLLSNGAEESFEEGMRAWVARHGAEFPPESTSILAIDTVGSPRLVLVEGEGMLVRSEYDRALKDELEAAAHDAGVPVIREHWLSFGSDALVGLRRGYPTALLASFDEFKLPANYHQPTDTAENVDFGTVEAAAQVVEALVRRTASAST